jgi:nascent polypeptide-associated complex subunit alpha
MGGDPRQMSVMMKKLGIDVNDIHDVQEVVIKTATKDYVFTNATVSVMKAQGTETWQISGTPTEAAHDVKLAINEDDVTMVAEQTGKSADEARAALESASGDLAEAIVALSE